MIDQLPKDAHPPQWLIFIVQAVLVGLLVLSTVHDCQSAEATWINFGGVSVHSKPGYNSQNPGFGIQQDIDAKDFVAFGGYKNSFDSISRYMTFGRRFVSDGVVAAGLFGGIVDGYKGRNHGNFDFLAAPFVSIEGRWAGVNLIFIPPAEKDGAAALSLQFKVRVQ